MQTRPRPAIVTLRMSSSLRDALHSAAAAAGCSLNGYALQILAAAAGDAARFRSVGEAQPAPHEPRDLARDEQGFPLQLKARGVHIVARSAFFEAMAAEAGASTAGRVVGEHDRDDPAFFAKWYLSREE